MDDVWKALLYPWTKKSFTWKWRISGFPNILMDNKHQLSGDTQICVEDLNSFICCTY